MLINGIQKLTLLDYPERVACTIFTAGCNFRCPFCHNAGLVTKINPADTIPTEEVLEFLKKRTGLLEGVCITGGEPLLQEDLEEFLREIKVLGYSIKLDTNGSNPKKLKALIEKGLIDYVAMDIKNSKALYSVTAGVEVDLRDINDSIHIIKESGIDYEFRTTVVKGLHSVQSISQLSAWIAPAKKYFLQGFQDSGNLIGEDLEAVSPKELEEMKRCATKFLPNAQIRGV